MTYRSRAESWSKAKRARAFASALAALSLVAGTASAQDATAPKSHETRAAKSGSSRTRPGKRPGALSRTASKERSEGPRASVKVGSEGAPIVEDRGERNAPVVKERGEGAAPVVKERGEGAAPVVKERSENAPAIGTKEPGEGAPAAGTKERSEGAAPATKERGEGAAPAAKERGEGAPAIGTKERSGSAPAIGTKERGEGPTSVAKDRGAKERAEASLPSSTSGGASASKGQEAAGSSKSRHGKTAKRERAGDGPCLRDRVEVARPTGEVDSFSFLRCDGKPADGAVERLAILLRPYSAPKPALPSSTASSGEARGREWAPGVRNADAGLLTRLQAVADHYRNKRIVVISGYRPGSVGSYHKDARAVDVRIEGVRNEDLVAFCRGLRDTGCGYYPNSSFVHFDVRPGGTGHVYWIDASGPGEAPRYVSSWPPPRDEPLLERLPKPEEAAPRDEHTHPDVTNKKAGRGLGASDRSDETPPPGTGRGAEKQI